MRPEASESRSDSLRFAGDLLQRLHPLCDLLRIALFFWTSHPDHLIKTGPTSLLRPVERLLTAAPRRSPSDTSLAAGIKRALSHNEPAELQPSARSDSILLLQPVSKAASEPLGVLIGAGELSAKAALRALMISIAASIKEHCRTSQLARAHREAVRLMGQALLSSDHAVLLVDSQLNVKLISPAAIKLLDFSPEHLEAGLDAALQLQPRELRWYCDGRLRRGQELVVTTPAKEVRVTADFHPVSLDSKEPLGTLLWIECLVGAPETPPEQTIATGFSGILGESADIVRARRSAFAASKISSNVLIEGPPGTGKGFFARVVHRESNRRDGPFVVIDCAAVAEGSLDAQLFGHVDGPLTSSSVPAAPGALDVAAGGTLFVNEVGMMPGSVQHKLNEAIRTGEFARIGADYPLPLNARIIAASSTNLSEKVQSGEFRGDLYYQLNITRIRLPALRERLGDLPEICLHMCRAISAQQGLEIRGVSPKVLSLFIKYDWPGNLDELRQILKAACISCKKGFIREKHLLSQMRARLESREAAFASDPLADERSRLWESERVLYQRALEITSWNVSQAAKLVGISRASLYRKLSKLRIQRL